MVYVPTNWQDYPNLGTPVTAARLNNIESGVSAAYVTGSGLLTSADLAVNAAIAHVAGRKTTSMAVTNTVADTDLLNGEFSVGAGALGTTGTVRLTAWGDWVQNSGGNASSPRFKVKLGVTPTVVFDTGALASSTSNSATRYGWRIVIEIMNSAAAVQWVTITGHIGFLGVSTIVSGVFATGEGTYRATGTTGALASIVGGNSAAIDTSAAMAVLLTVINPSATTTETKLMGAIMEIL